ncbi:MAG: hypothetical protein MET45_02425 [Nostoc sp. LLA-1]|nr:hypothetical protein [Cyanocohniella sp. LLY]
MLNLAKIGRASPEFMPVDKNRRVALVEAGSKTKSNLNRLEAVLLSGNL